jgi:endonuclease-3
VASSPRKKQVVKKEVEVQVANGDVVKAEEVKVEKDDVETTIEIKSEEVGNVAIQGIPDIEDLANGA